jgi:hypothetical protein
LGHHVAVMIKDARYHPVVLTRIGVSG